MTIPRSSAGGHLTVLLATAALSTLWAGRAFALPCHAGHDDCCAGTAWYELPDGTIIMCEDETIVVTDDPPGHCEADLASCLPGGSGGGGGGGYGGGDYGGGSDPSPPEIDICAVGETEAALHPVINEGENCAEAQDDCLDWGSGLAAECREGATKYWSQHCGKQHPVTSPEFVGGVLKLPNPKRYFEHRAFNACVHDHSHVQGAYSVGLSIAGYGISAGGGSVYSPGWTIEECNNEWADAAKACYEAVGPCPDGCSEED